METKERYELYLKEHYRYQALHEQNLVNQDSALIQLSVGLLAILATLGKGVLFINKTIGIITVVFLSLTIIQVILGYFLSNRFFVFVKAKLRENYDKKIEEIGEGLDSGAAGAINDIFNVTSYVTFVLAIVFFFVLLMIYIWSAK